MYLAKVERADKLFGELRRDVDAVERLQVRGAEAESRMVALKTQPTDKTTPEARENALNAAKADAEKIEERLVEAVSDTESKFLRYYKLRSDIAGDYAAFVKSNRYRWRDVEGKQNFFEKWRVVEFHHHRIDNLALGFLVFLNEKDKLRQARLRALKTITSYNNWGKNPRKGQKKP